MSEQKVQWPGSAYSEAGDDLSPPVRQLLYDLRLLELPTEEGKGGVLTTPQSLQVLTSGATALGKGWATLVGLVSGGGAVLTGLEGLSGVGAGDALQRAVFVASSAVMLAAAAVSVAMIIKADMTARASASAAEYQARAAVTTAMLSSLQFGPPRPAPTSPDKPEYILQKTTGEWEPVQRFEWHNQALHALTDTGPVPPGDMKVVVGAHCWQRGASRNGSAPVRP